MLVTLAALIQTAIIPELETPPQRAVAEQPLVELFSYEDYPSDALARGSRGRVRVRLLVGPDGRAQACEVTEGAEDESLNAVTCAILLERSRFEPARDARGRAVRDVVSTRVRWELAEVPMPFAEGRTVTSFRGGATTSCTFAAGDETSDLPVDLCVGIFGPFASMAIQPDVEELRFESRLAPAGAASETPPPRAAGETLWRYAGEITIAPNGTVSRCTVATSAPGPGIPEEFGAALDPCTGFRSDTYVEQEQGRELRHATFEGIYTVIPGRAR